MMTRRICKTLVLLAVMSLPLALAGCDADPLAGLASPQPATVSANEALSAAPAREQSACLWFRYLDEPYLAREERMIISGGAASRERRLMEALLAGPQASSTGLMPLFPPGVRLLSTHQNGRILFVTLSRQIMDPWPDEPAAWSSDPYWRAEVPLRRRLAMQAIAATMTENCDVDQVIILCEQTDASSESMRLRESYYRAGDRSSQLAAPLTRPDDCLLTPDNTLEVILTCWSERSWSRLQRYCAASSDAPVDTDAFSARMEALPHLTAFTAGSASLSPDGREAVFPLEATYLLDGQPVTHRGMIRLTQQHGQWRIPLSQLEGREAAP